MSRKLEDYVPVVKEDGIVTDKNVTIAGTLTVTGAQTFTGNTGTAGVVVAKSGSSATAGGAEAVRIGTGASGVLGVYFGSGAPTISAPQGSLNLRTDGSSTSTRLYVNTTGATTWTNVTTAA